MKVLDRLSGQRLDALPDEVHLLGRYSLEPEHGAVFLNGTPVSAGDYLVSNSSGEWRLITDEGTGTRGVFLAGFLPDEQETKAFLSFSELLLEGNSIEWSWFDWCNLSPIAPGLGDEIKAHPLEAVIEREFNHLTEICRRPQTHIRLESERVRVDRARRFDRNVYAHLSAHTEDWAQRKLTGVQPSHVLAQVREEQWDLYENRVAARLVDNLVHWVRDRLIDVRRILDKVFKELEEQRVAGANWRRRDRLYRIWGEATEATEARQMAENTCKRLEALLYRLLGLMDTPLYDHIPQRAKVPQGLRMTNLFTNHNHYRGVARLWSAWAHHAAPCSLSASQLYHRRQRLVRGFDAWCMLLVVRALEQLHCQPLDEDLETVLQPGIELALRNGLRVSWRWDGIRLLDGDCSLVRFVPLVHALEGVGTTLLEDFDSDLRRAVTAAQEWTVILYPAPAGAVGSSALADPINLPLPPATGELDLLQVSPLGLNSVERVSRLLRWAILVPRMLAYPPVLGSVPVEFVERMGGRLGRKEDEYVLREAIPKYEVTALGVSETLRNAEVAYDSLVAERDAIDQELREVRGKYRTMAELNRKKRLYPERITEAEKRAESIAEFETALLEANKVLEALSDCPVCRNKGELKSRDKDCYLAVCRDAGCGASWGLQVGQAGERIPILEIGGLQEIQGYEPARIDELIGCDVLAVPYWENGERIKWRAPRKTTTDVAQYLRTLG